jgi:glycosyltransferase involved in cell wall biosynthesis
MTYGSFETASMGVEEFGKRVLNVIMKFDDYISVVLTAYNSSDYLRMAIQSILNQTYWKFELIVVNDGSTDDTESIVKSFSDDRIKYFCIKHSGMGGALNFGLKNAKYEWLALMDSDDIARSERFTFELNYKNLVYNDVIFPDSVYFKGSKIQFLNTISGDNTVVREKIRMHGHICMSGVIFNKNFILANGGFDETLGNSEDYDLWMRLFEKVNFVHVNVPLMYVRMRKDSLSRENYKNVMNTIYSIKRKYNIRYSGISAGWNEFFYGSKEKARVVFKKHLRNPNAAAGYAVSLLPDRAFNYIIDKKVVPRLKYSIYKLIFFRKHRKLLHSLKKSWITPGNLHYYK